VHFHATATRAGPPTGRLGAPRAAQVQFAAMPGADGMSAKFMKNAFVGWTFSAGLYYPPDFDASKLMPMKMLKAKGEKEKVMNIRMMFPFTMVCDTCSEYNYTGTKFTAKVEHIKGESYLGLKVYRFYGRCLHCWAEFTFKTDPKNSDYTMESGGKRTYEAWKDADMMENELKKEQEREAAQDHMKALEQKAVDVHSEMQRLEDLDAIRTLNKRMGARDQSIENALEYLFKKGEAKEEEEEPLGHGELAELAGFREAQEETRWRKLDEEVEGNGGETPASTSTTASTRSCGAPSGSLASISPAGAAIASAVAERVANNSNREKQVGARLSIKRKAPEVDSEVAEKRQATAASPAPASASASTGSGALSLGAYDSDSS